MRPLLVFALLLTAASDAFSQTCDRSPLVIRNVTVWTSGGLLPGRDVLLRDGKVASIAPSGATATKGQRMLDGSGHTLLPGLVDSHLHFSVPGGLPRTDAPRTDTSVITARQLITSGVTSGRLHLATLDEAIDLKKRALDPCGAIPLLQVGGPGISGALEKDFNNFQGARTAEEAIGKVEKFSAAGIEWLAIHDAHRLAPGVLPALAGAAKKSGMRLMAQGASPDEIGASLGIAPDTLDYIDRTSDPGYRQDVLDQIRAARDIVIVPTVGVAYRLMEFTREPSLLDASANFRLFSPPDAAFVLDNAKKEIAGAGLNNARRFAPTMANKLKQLRTLGLTVAVGSDAGSSLHFQSNAIWWEMEAWRAAGVSHREVLTAATEHGARVLRMTDIGHLRAGGRADFVLYRGNVEEGPLDVARVIAVGKGGVLMTGEASPAR